MDFLKSRGAGSGRGWGCETSHSSHFFSWLAFGKPGARLNYMIYSDGLEAEAQVMIDGC